MSLEESAIINALKNNPVLTQKQISELVGSQREQLRDVR